MAPHFFVRNYGLVIVWHKGQIPNKVHIVNEILKSDFKNQPDFACPFCRNSSGSLART